MNYTKVEIEFRGGDSPYGWSQDAYKVKVGTITVYTTPDKGSAVRFAEKLEKEIKFLVNKND